MGILKGEPILVSAGSVMAGAAAILYLLTEFGVNITEGQSAALTGVISAVAIPLATWFLARRHTVTVGSANEAIDRGVLDAQSGRVVDYFEVGTTQPDAPDEKVYARRE